jgi:mannose-1-phosphate guanylyltransferase
MKAVILVGGEGTRLKPLTCNTPKAIVPILNRPFLEHMLRYLHSHGITDVILALGYLPDPIQQCLGDGRQFGVKLTFLVEDSPLGTAGAVKNAEQFLDDTFVVFNGDVLTEIDLSDMIKQHRTMKPKVSIALTPVDNPTIYGVAETDADGRVRRFVEKPTWDKVTTNMINAGIYVLEPEVLALIPPVTRFMFEHHVFPSLLEKGELMLAYPSDAYWIDIGTPEKYLKVNHDLLRRWGKEVRQQGESRIAASARIEGPVLIGRDCVIAEGVRITGPTVLGPKCQVAAGATIERAVVWGGSKVAEEATLKNCIVGASNCIESHCFIPEECVLGDNVTVESGSKLARGAHVPPNSYVKSDLSR